MYKKQLTGTAPDYSKKEHWLMLTENPDKAVDMM